MPSTLLEQKICLACGWDKPLSDFYTHPEMRDGHLNRCKECVRLRIKAYNLAHPDKVRKVQREKRRRPKYREMDRNWRLRNPERRKAHMHKWAEQNQDKRRAEIAVGNAIRDGRLVRAQYCQRCGRSGGIEAHHPDYSKCLEVQWLCTTCHGETRIKVSQIMPAGTKEN